MSFFLHQYIYTKVKLPTKRRLTKIINPFENLAMLNFSVLCKMLFQKHNFIKFIFAQGRLGLIPGIL